MSLWQSRVYMERPDSIDTGVASKAEEIARLQDELATAEKAENDARRNHWDTALEYNAGQTEDNRTAAVRALGAYHIAIGKTNEAKRALEAARRL